MKTQAHKYVITALMMFSINSPALIIGQNFNEGRTNAIDDPHVSSPNAGTKTPRFLVNLQDSFADGDTSEPESEEALRISKILSSASGKNPVLVDIGQMPADRL